ncbi:PLD nuclease N-terminal domain-containing protein [Thermoanaerobacterium saccharolyticum]|uniref:PLDc N-terminal domain-containing protein n=1 Tax=Thermoanaerobacterium saccharolyticum TaxID=28896 RepID=UPI0005EF432B
MFDNLNTSEIIRLFAPLIIIQLGLMIFSIYRLTKDKVKFLPKWAWLIIIVLGEILGPLMFLIIGREKE